MKNIVLLSIFVLGIVLLQYVKSQSADDIINKYLEARGGRDRLNAIRSIYMEGFREMMGYKMPVSVTIVPEKLYRTDFEFEGIAGYTIVTPSQGWSFIPLRSQNAESIPAELLAVMQLQMDIAAPLISYPAKGKAELRQKDIIHGRESYSIKMTLNNSQEIIFFIDKETDLLIQSRQMSADLTNNTPGEIITNYSDYKEFDGIMFPQTITNTGNEIMTGVTTFNTIIINKTIDDDQYKI